MVDISKTFNRPLKSEILNGARQLLNKKWGPIRKLSLIAHAFARFTPLLVLSSAKSVSKNNNDLKAFAFKQKGAAFSAASQLYLNAKARRTPRNAKGLF
jgi:hypothetical protein